MRTSAVAVTRRRTNDFAGAGHERDHWALPASERRDQSMHMTNFDNPYDRVRKLPKQFKPLRAYEEERRRGLVHTPEYDEQMRALKEEFQRWLLAE
jgi:hypothetical protein